MRDSKVDANVGRPRSPTARRRAGIRGEESGEFVRQTGGSGRYGDVVINLLPQAPGGRVRGQDRGRKDPEEVHQAGRRGIQGRSARAVLAGYPVVDVKVELVEELVPRRRLELAGLQDRRLDRLQGGDEARPNRSCSSR